MNATTWKIRLLNPPFIHVASDKTECLKHNILCSKRTTKKTKEKKTDTIIANTGPEKEKNHRSPSSSRVHFGERQPLKFTRSRVPSRSGKMAVDGAPDYYVLGSPVERYSFHSLSYGMWTLPANSIKHAIPSIQRKIPRAVSWTGK